MRFFVPILEITITFIFVIAIYFSHEVEYRPRYPIMVKNKKKKKNTAAPLIEPGISLVQEE